MASAYFAPVNTDLYLHCIYTVFTGPGFQIRVIRILSPPQRRFHVPKATPFWQDGSVFAGFTSLF